MLREGFPKLATHIDVEGFAGLSVRDFNPIEVFAEILSRCRPTPEVLII